jgi:hypothetical protein
LRSSCPTSRSSSCRRSGAEQTWPPSVQTRRLSRYDARACVQQGCLWSRGAAGRQEGAGGEIYRRETEIVREGGGWVGGSKCFCLNLRRLCILWKHAVRCVMLCQVKHFHLHHELFSVDNDLLTPTFKLKRPQVAAPSSFSSSSRPYASSHPSLSRRKKCSNRKSTPCDPTLAAAHMSRCLTFHAGTAEHTSVSRPPATAAQPQQCSSPSWTPRTSSVALHSDNVLFILNISQKV